VEAEDSDAGRDTVVVADLFFHYSARLKFLKTDSTESTLISIWSQNGLPTPI
jgi:DNA mismatch repair ATPase MutL